MIYKGFHFLTPRDFIFNPFYVTISQLGKLFSSSLVKVSQNFEVLHWAVIRSGNLPVSALEALFLQYLLTPNSHLKNLF